MRATFLILLSILFFLSTFTNAEDCRTQPFLSGSRFNALFFGNFYAPSADVEGALAAKGNIDVTSYTIGLKLSCDDKTDNAIAGGSFKWNGGDLMTGNLVYNKVKQLSSYSVRCGSEIDRDSSEYFAQLESDIKSTSAYLNSLESTGEGYKQYSSYKFDITDGPTVNVFHTTCSAINDNGVSEYVILGGKSTQTLIINVEGTTGCGLRGGGFQFNGFSEKRVIWNFPQATSLAIYATYGTVMAPYADVTFQWGAIEGQLIGKSFSGAGQINYKIFDGCIPQEDTPPVEDKCVGFDIPDQCDCYTDGDECVCSCQCC